MNIMKMRRKDFLELPVMDVFKEDIGEYDSLVIIPTGRKHDSGYQIMDFVPVDDDGEPICRISGFLDVIEIDGIGGFGEREPPFIPQHAPLNGWKIDCIPCGYLRLFCRGSMTNGHAVSDFEVFGHARLWDR